MDCDRIKILLSGYLDKELSPGEVKKVEEHLETCASCRADLDLLKNYLSLAEKVKKTSPPEHLKEGAWAGMTGSRHRPHPSPVPARIITNRTFQVISFSLAALLILAYFVISPNFLNTTRLESDFAYEVTKIGKAPADRKGHLVDETREAALLDSIAREIDGTVIEKGYNQKTGMTDFVTIRLQKKNYGKFRTLLADAGIAVSLPPSLKHISGYVLLQLYFPGRKFVSGDFNGDGSTDLAVYFRRGRLAGNWFVAWHDKGESFSLPAPVRVGDATINPGEFSSILSGNFNDDKLSDIMIASPEGKLQLFVNTGKNSFRHFQKTDITIQLPSSEGIFKPLTGDLNGDGLDDLVVHYQAGGLVGRWFVFMNAGQGRFEEAAEYPVAEQVFDPESRYTPLILDFNGDGYDDCCIYWQDGELIARWHIAINDKNGNFGNPFQVFFGNSPRAFEGDYFPYTGDFNGDGFDDLLVKGGTEDEAGEWYLLYNENGTKFTHGYDCTFGGDPVFLIK